ncbi:MAG TPA: squalene synthase HpnC [Ideonella sp.]|uniref:squalene synthase HpnC n=1 Tax=Ideonella sp. TaxID=1929293 RepID=UPI002D189673|nr:squalene synthase HpnC [Ideonella sp.]HSI47343.1 squalene synthase HpnC [Ideonella sp.]
MSVDHYENFPVASWLCPPRLRPPIAAIYWFARTGDDIADEGDAPAETRRTELQAYRAELQRVARGETPAARWAPIFRPLQQAMQQHALPHALLDDLLAAFLCDVANPAYATRDALLGYCRLSANPVGRLLLHLHHIDDGTALAQSDAICSALQLINFWQDLSVDLPRGRCYLPASDLARHGLQADRLQSGSAAQAMVRELCDWARELMLQGAPLVHRLPGRAGWELRLVVQGGLRILEKIDHMHHQTLTQRPKLRRTDALPLLWRALRMPRPRPSLALPA